MNILITGGAGFIGSNLIQHWLKNYDNDFIVNFDCLTYAGNLTNLKNSENNPNYALFKGDLCNKEDIKNAFEKHKIEGVIHLAAESHVDRSIEGPEAFIQTNIVGTYNLLEVAKQFWQNNLNSHRFHHVSTDEVFGSLGPTGYFTENTPYSPNSPYSASKASSDHLVRAYHHTYGMNIVVSNCSNNYGPYQFPEKLLPLLIKNCLDKQTIPVYGDGSNVRDWLYVKDHCRAIDCIFHKGNIGESYNVGGGSEWKNIDIVRYVCQCLDRVLGNSTANSCSNLIKFVKDRLGHDKRYAIDASKISKELGWEAKYSFEEGIKETIDWYINNQNWIKEVTSGEYLKYYTKQYGDRC